MDVPCFVVVAGPPCAGKSTVARHLSHVLASPHLEMDQFRRRVLPLSDQRVEDRDIAYNAMHLAAELMVPWCRAVILDATYTAAVCRTGLADVVERTGGALFVIECHLHPGAAVARFHGRGAHPAVDLTPDRVASLAADYPYSPAACAIKTDVEVPEFSRILGGLTERPLDQAARAEWCLQGRPRERTADSQQRTEVTSSR